MKIRIYTDGACSGNPGAGGWAAVFNVKNKCIKISGGEQETTNNRMELTAVIEALKRIIKWKNHYEFDYEIFSDSAYVVNAINNDWLGKWQLNNWKTTKSEDVKNRDLWEEFFALRIKLKTLGVRVSFIKIKGHSGNSFNELVDELAKAEYKILQGR